MVFASSSAFSQRRDAFKVWNRVGLSCLLAALATGLTNETSFEGIVLYVSGVIPAWLLGWFVLRQLLRDENYKETPFMYRGLAEKKPIASIVFLFGCLGLISFPITPAFLGQDLLLFAVSEHHPAIIILLALTFVVNGIATANIYMRLCMGRPVEVPREEKRDDHVKELTSVS
jgi:NADH:ubiquinone oxidoreductase subunit 2 (subunit N)